MQHTSIVPFCPPSSSRSQENPITRAMSPTMHPSEGIPRGVPATCRVCQQMTYVRNHGLCWLRPIRTSSVLGQGGVLRLLLLLSVHPPGHRRVHYFPGCSTSGELEAAYHLPGEHLANQGHRGHWSDLNARRHGKQCRRHRGWSCSRVGAWSSARSGSSGVSVTPTGAQWTHGMPALEGAAPPPSPRNDRTWSQWQRGGPGPRIS